MPVCIICLYQETYPLLELLQTKIDKQHCVRPLFGQASSIFSPMETIH